VVRHDPALFGTVDAAAVAQVVGKMIGIVLR